MHVFYRDYFNLIDLINGHWYAVEEHHHHQNCKTKVILAILHNAAINAWGYTTKLDYLECPAWRTALVQKLLQLVVGFYMFPTKIHFFLTAHGGLGSTGIDGCNGATSSSTGVSCGVGGGMGSVNTSTYGTGGTRTFPRQDGTIYETSTSGEQSGYQLPPELQMELMALEEEHLVEQQTN